MGPTRGRGNGCRFLLLVTVLVAGAADMAAAQQASPSGPGTGSNYFDSKNFNPSMAVLIVVLVTAFFFLGFFSIYIRRCAGGPFGRPGEHLGAAGSRPGGITFASGAVRSRRMRGLDPAVLEALPTMAYADVKVHKVGKGELECAVCLSEFDDDETLRLLPVCSHAFHTDCIDAWLASHVTCPVCRANLAHDAEAPAVAGVATSEAEQDVPPVTPHPAHEAATVPLEQLTVVAIDAEETGEERIRRAEAAELMRIGSLKRALRSKSARRPAQFPRSHTTGHSLAAPPAAAGDSAERYTLRLPEQVLREVVAARASKLRRTASLLAFRTGGGADGSTRARAGRSVRLGQSGRWPSMSSLARTFSARLPAWGSARRADADAPGEGAKVAGDVEQQCDGGVCPLQVGGRV